MRTRAGEESLKSGRRLGTSGNDGLHSINGGVGSNGRQTDGQGSNCDAGGSLGGDEASVGQAPWFSPIEEDSEGAVSDCPGGICPVPWAKDLEEEEKQTTAKEKRETPWDTYLKKHAEIWEESDTVNHPSHYTAGSIECIEAIEAQLTKEEYRGYLKGNVAKYLWREKQKGGTESLQKAQWYLSRLIELD
jgi:hypothetical protein